MRKRMWMIGITGVMILSGCGEPARPASSAVDSVYSLEMTGGQMLGRKIVESAVAFVQIDEETTTNDNAPKKSAGQAGEPVPQEFPEKPDQEVVIPEKEGNTIPSEAGKTAITEITEEPNRQADSEAQPHQSSTPAATGGSGSSGNTNNSAGNTSGAATPSQPAHTHSWVEQTTTVTHEATGHYETKVVKEAWDEQIRGERVVCGCGELCVTVDEWLSHCLADGCRQGYSVKSVVVDTIHHEAESEQVWVEDTPAYTETVVTGYKCSGCGATK